MSSIAVAKSAMGYTPAGERQDCCANCTQFDQVFPERAPPWDKPSFLCKRGGFRVSRFSICDQHAIKPAGAP